MKKISRDEFYGPGVEKLLLDCRSPSAVAVALPQPSAGGQSLPEGAWRRDVPAMPALTQQRVL